MLDPTSTHAPTLDEIRAAFRMLGLSTDENARGDLPPGWQQREAVQSDEVIVVRSNSSSPTRLPDGCYA